MAFPSTPVLFSGVIANEDPLSDGGLILGPIFTVDGRPKIVSNQMVAGVSVNSEAYWGTVMQGNDQEVYATLAAVPTTSGHGIEVYLGIKSPNTVGATGYSWYWEKGSNNFQMYRHDSAASATQLGSTVSTITMGVGDRLLLRRRGSRLEGWYLSAAGVQTLVVQADDVTYVDQGYIGLNIVNDTTTAITNFGGGLTTQDASALIVAVPNQYVGPMALRNRVRPPRQFPWQTATAPAGVPQAITPNTGISATSAVTGSVTALKAVVPSAVNATSSVTGKVTALKAVVPAAVNATSAMSATVGRGRVITPGAINSTSTMTGGIQALRKITPAAINATSAVTGSVQAFKHVTPAAIGSTSAVTGSVRALRNVTPAAVNATSSVTGSVHMARGVTPSSVLATSTISGTVVALKHITGGTILATSSITATATGGSGTGHRHLAPSISLTLAPSEAPTVGGRHSS